MKIQKQLQEMVQEVMMMMMRDDFNENSIIEKKDAFK